MSLTSGSSFLKSAVRQNRKSYWDSSYKDYWMRRVEETNLTKSKPSKINQGDKPTSSDRSYIEAVGSLSINKSSCVLEMGCGYGRSIPYLISQSKFVFGLDISSAMIHEAKKRCFAENVSFHVGEAENTGFENNKFSHIVCFAVFDAVFQLEALTEMNRILQVGGELFLTGKNDDYFDDDSEALTAEVNARKKRHPNYFTNTRFLLSSFEKFGFSVCKQKFFLRRGDAASSLYSEALPSRFYEYHFVLKKEDKCIAQLRDEDISSAYSKTWKRVQPDSSFKVTQRHV